MSLYKKILKYTLLIIGIVFLGFVIISNILTNYYGYEKVDASSNPDFKKSGLLSDSAIKTINIESLYEEKLGDSIFFCKFQDSLRLISWNIYQYKNSTLSITQDTFQTKIEKAQLTYYVDIDAPIDERISLESKAFLLNDLSLSVHFQNCKKIRYIKGVDYQYYHLKAGSIYLVSNGNKAYDICISFTSETDMDFLIRSYKDKVTILIMYLLNNKDIAPGKLINVLRK